MAKKESQLIKEEELKGNFLEISGRLPENWIDIYLDTFCMNLRGSVIRGKIKKLENIKKGNEIPKPSEMKNIRKLLESNKEKQLQAHK